MSDLSETAEAIAMIRGSAAGIADRQDLSRIRALRYTLAGFDRDGWDDLCAMGWLGLRLPERSGGVGLGMAAGCALLEELGAALFPAPLIGAMLAIRVIAEEEEEAGAALTGRRIVLPAWQEEARTVDLHGATRWDGGRITGVKRYVAMAAGADAFAVAVDDGWALVERDAPGLSLEVLPTQDGGHYGTLRFDRVGAQPLQPVDATGPLAEAALATAAYLLGVLEETLRRTLEFLRTRVQFGRPIGSFQAVQHRLVDLELEAALTRASIADAARRWDAAPGGRDALAAISRAKARACGTAMLVTRQAIQLHGGIGYTDEHDIGLFLRKAMVVAPSYGDETTHRRRFAELDADALEQAA